MLRECQCVYVSVCVSSLWLWHARYLSISPVLLLPHLVLATFLSHTRHATQDSVTCHTIDAHMAHTTVLGVFQRFVPVCCVASATRQAEDEEDHHAQGSEDGGRVSSGRATGGTTLTRHLLDEGL